MTAFRIGPINIESHPYWGVQKCDGSITAIPVAHTIRADCGCGFRSEWVSDSRYQDVSDLLSWHFKDQFDRSKSC